MKAVRACAVKAHGRKALRIALVAGVLALANTASAMARDHRGAGEFIVLPGTDHKLRLGSLRGDVDDALVAALTRWIVANSDLPMAPPPRIERLAPEVVARERASATSDAGRTGSGGFSDGAALLSIYVDASRTIFLREDWRGRDYRELSLLVHELTHHLQNADGRIYACANEREKLAYRLQEKWLNHFRRSLASEFNLDPFRMLLKTSCIF